AACPWHLRCRSGHGLGQNSEMRLASFVCLLAAGCGFEHGTSNDDDQHDAAIDGPRNDVPDGPCESYSTLFDTCTAMVGMSGVTLTPGAWTYDTDTHRLTGGSSSGTTLPSTVIGP